MSEAGIRYRSVLNGKMIEIVKPGEDRTTVIDVKPDGVMENQRDIDTSQLHPTVTNQERVPYRSGYVRADRKEQKRE